VQVRPEKTVEAALSKRVYACHYQVIRTASTFHHVLRSVK